VLYQIGALEAMARAEGLALQHVKPHGALYNMAARDASLARAIASAVASFDRELLLFAPPGSELARAALAAGLRVVLEGFADRDYAADGSLRPRSEAGAVLDDPSAVVERAVRMVRQRTVRAAGGIEIPLPVQTICVHGDTPGSSELARRLRAGLEAAGIQVRAAGS
jgi:5-oxoprolinase (ATP-hydrolysing) subunit A